MSTDCLFREDAYLKECSATVVGVTEAGGIVLDRTVLYPVTGGAVGDRDGRLDFDIPEAGLDKDAITAELAKMIAAGAAVKSRWITDAELEANPRLIKTMSVKPPMGTGRVRLIEIVGYDIQPCGGTHVRTTREIGDMRVTQIEKKGKQNRRVRLAFAAPSEPSP